MSNISMTAQFACLKSNGFVIPQDLIDMGFKEKFNYNLLSKERTFVYEHIKVRYHLNKDIKYLLVGDVWLNGKSISEVRYFDQDFRKLLDNELLRIKRNNIINELI